MAWKMRMLGNKGRKIYLETGVGLDADWTSDPVDISGASAIWVGMCNRTSGSMTGTSTQLEAQWNRNWTGTAIWLDALYMERGAGSPSDTAIDLDASPNGISAMVWFDGGGDCPYGAWPPHPELRLLTENSNAADTAFSADFFVIVEE